MSKKKKRETSRKEEGKENKREVRIINLHVVKLSPVGQRIFHPHCLREEEKVLLLPSSSEISGDLCFFFCFCIFSGFFFLQWANNQKKKTQKQQQQESYFEAGGLEDLILLPLYSLFSFPESSVVQGGLWAEEIRPQSSEAAQSRDFWPSRFPHSLLPAPNPTRTHFTAPTFNPPNATKSAN